MAYRHYQKWILRRIQDSNNVCMKPSLTIVNNQLLTRAKISSILEVAGVQICSCLFFQFIKNTDRLNQRFDIVIERSWKVELVYLKLQKDIGDSFLTNGQNVCEGSRWRFSIPQKLLIKIRSTTVNLYFKYTIQYAVEDAWNDSNSIKV